MTLPRFALAAAASLLVLGAAHAAEAPKKPNILFILADDLGMDGVSCYGSDKHKTPQIDKLAASGLRFETCYAAPLCGPSRCLLMTGRYAFHTGGLGNDSWKKGIGAVSADEHPMAAMLKKAGYATGMAGKWRQVGETPSDWGFDQYVTDPTASGYYWKTPVFENGKELNLPAGSYNPDYIQKFAEKFIEDHKDGPFFFYYPMHFVHKPTLHTPDSPKEDGAERYDDNIAYMDKQVGALVAELDRLGLRKNTLVLFSGDNGTARGYPSLLHGRMINGCKGSMLEGGARVPYIASWPGVTPAGKVSPDIITFADSLVTFLDLAGMPVPAGVKYDGQSFAAQLRGEKGTPRASAYVQLVGHWYVREPGWKMDESSNLFDMSDAPYVEKPAPVAQDTDASKAARARLTATLAELNPAAGKTQKTSKSGRKRAKNGLGEGEMKNDPDE